MKKLLLLLLNLFFVAVAEENSWNILVYMECAQSLHEAALKNLHEMATSVSDGINLFVIIHARGNYVWLYRITKHTISQLHEYYLDGYASHVIVPVMRMIIQDFPAKHHALILWNHGFGILVPHYNPDNNEWELSVDESESAQCSIRCLRNNTHVHHKGMLVNTVTNTCMNNDELILLVKTICEDCLQGKKIDILGLDMCKGAMLEHVYQLRHYVHHLIGSQECELRDGWPYELIFNAFKNHPSVNAKKCAQLIVEAFGNYYQQHAPIGIYTQSALCTESVEDIKQQLDSIIEQLFVLIDGNESILNLIKKVRASCRPFCDAPMYMDVITFFSTLREQLLMQFDSDEIITLADDIQKLCAQLKNMVIANVAGHAIENQVHGISIYCPRIGIDESYPNVPFAQESKWDLFIEKLLHNNQNLNGGLIT